VLGDCDHDQHARDRGVEQLRHRTQRLATHLLAIDDFDADGERPPGRSHGAARDDDALENAHASARSRAC